MEKSDQLTMIKKIISGGQTGVDQAALDVAINLGIPHGGWIPRGRKTENGILPAQYQLKEMPTSSYPKRTEQNVIDSDGTLIISHGKLTGGSLFTLKMAKEHRRPCLHIDLSKGNAFEDAMKINTWIETNQIEVLNVAGPRASKDPEIYEEVKTLLQTAYHMNIVLKEMPDPNLVAPSLPQTVDEAVERLISEISLKHKLEIAKMEGPELVTLQPSLGRYIRNKYELWAENGPLMLSCRLRSGIADLHEDDASALIIIELWKKLRETHLLRVVG
jgi:hypothetical protein